MATSNDVKLYSTSTFLLGDNDVKLRAVEVDVPATLDIVLRDVTGLGNDVKLYVPGEADGAPAAVAGDVAFTLDDITIVAEGTFVGAGGSVSGSVTFTLASISASIRGVQLMGATLDAIRTGSLTHQWVAAIEGYDYLLTDGDPAAAVTAWAGTEWSQALGGLVVVGDWEQRLDPWDSMPGGGTMTLYILPDSADTFGVATAKGRSSVSTYLDAEIDNDDTTITVLSTGSFAASGTAYIGTEAITYSGKTATTLTGCTRGRYHPFSTQAGTANRFGVTHRSSTTENESIIEPLVSQAPRVWLGKWVGLWMHAKTGSALDTKSGAQLSFAGRIVEIRDDAQTGCTIVQVEGILDVVRNAALGRDLFTADVAEGVYLPDGERFTYSDSNGTTTFTADDLVVETGGAIEPGYYTVAEICTYINQWLYNELDAARISATVTFASPFQMPDGTYRTKVQWRGAGAVTTYNEINFDGPDMAMRALGWGGSGNSNTQDGGAGATSHVLYSTSAPFRYMVNVSTSLDMRVAVENAVGSFDDQRTTMPASLQPLVNTDTSLSWGIFKVGASYFAASYDSVASEIANVSVVRELQLGEQLLTPLGEVNVRYGEGSPTITIQQVMFVEGEASELIPRIFASTGTSAYNHPTYDNLPASMGVAMPWELLGSDFEDSCQKLDGSGATITLVVDKQTRLVDLLGADLLARRCGLVFRDGALRFAQWQTPGGVDAVYALTEANKASPASADIVERSPSVLTDQWQRSVVKFEYNRDPQADTYADTMVIEDRAAIDDAGGEVRPVTIKLRNMLGTPGTTSPAVQALAANFLAWMPMFSRPVRLLTRSIDFRYFESFAPGDVVTVSDAFARDPSTGARGISGRYGIIVRHRCDWGGPSPGDPTSVREPVGEVDIVFVDLDVSAKYAPSARVDTTYTAGAFTTGYDSAGFKIKLQANAFTLSSLGGTDVDHFDVGDEVTIHEIDPTVPGTYDAWSVTISAKGTNELTLDAALTGFDGANKEYRVVSQTYSAATTTQRAHTYQADAGDGLIEDLAVPFTYAASDLFGTRGHSDADLPERHSTLLYGDGEPLDAGGDLGMARMINNLLRVKTKISTPMLGDSITATATGAGDWDLLQIIPVFLGPQEFATGWRRYLRVAPWLRSSDGTATNIRVTISRHWPRPLDEADADNNTRRLMPFKTATWATSSTTWATGADADMDVGPAGDDGIVWIIVEGNTKAQTRGLAKCYLTRPHQVTP